MRTHRLHKEPRSILLVSYGGIGDLLLTTPLLASLKTAFADAQIDVYVQAGREGMLEGNPTVSRRLTVEQRHGAATYVRFLVEHSCRYDLAVSVRVSDRQVLLARAAGRTAIGLAPKRGDNAWWKQRILSGWAGTDASSHAVFDILQLADVLAIQRITTCRAPENPDSGQRLDDVLPFAWRDTPFTVLHLTPRNTYKEWTPAGWEAVTRHLLSRDQRVVLVGGRADRDLAFAEHLTDRTGTGVVNITGKTSFADAAELLRHCHLYVGPDTATTHLAAVVNAPTVALYGDFPTRYPPYHNALDRAPYAATAACVYESGPVHMITACPSNRTATEGGAPTIAETSAYMQSIAPAMVIDVVDEVLAPRPVTPPGADSSQ